MIDNLGAMVIDDVELNGLPENEVELNELVALGFFGEPDEEFDEELYSKFLEHIRQE